jgi:hypothetical protein
MKAYCSESLVFQSLAKLQLLIFPNCEKMTLRSLMRILFLGELVQFANEEGVVRRLDVFTRQVVEHLEDYFSGFGLVLVHFGLKGFQGVGVYCVVLLKLLEVNPIAEVLFGLPWGESVMSVLRNLSALRETGHR